MTHFELIEYGTKLGLAVRTLRFYDQYIQQHVFEAFFAIPNGDRITKFRMHYGMDTVEYSDAMAQCENDLNKFATWR